MQWLAVLLVMAMHAAAESCAAPGCTAHRVQDREHVAPDLAKGSTANDTSGGMGAPGGGDVEAGEGNIEAEDFAGAMGSPRIQSAASAPRMGTITMRASGAIPEAEVGGGPPPHPAKTSRLRAPRRQMSRRRSVARCAVGRRRSERSRAGHARQP